jgi:prepilin-type N-terminal cleavage/methylation domain-containing protein
MNQKGMTLIELLIALAIASSVVAGAALAIFQLITTPERNSNYMTAFTQVQNAGFSISRDAVQARNVTVDGSSFLTLDWKDWDDNTHEAVYTLKDASDELKELWRTYSINGSPPETMVVAEYLVGPPGTSCSWDDIENVLTLNVTAQVGDKTATRTYKVEPRPDS